MRWKFWKKAAPQQPQQQQPPEADRSFGRRKKRRHFEASCIAGADTGDEDFIFEGFERRTPFAVQQPPTQPMANQPPSQLQQSSSQPSQPSPPPPLPPPRKKGSHTLPRFLRRAASVGRGKAAAADEPGTSAAANGARVVEKATTSSDEGLPSASSGDLLSAEDDSPLAFCPHCRAVVQPLTVKKRSQIRTNPWLKERKRPRIEYSGVMQKSLDSGISGIEEVGSRVPPSMEPIETTATAAQTEEFEDAGPDEYEQQAVLTQVGSDSDTCSTTPVLERHQFQAKRKVLKKRRHRLRQQQQSPERQQQQHWDVTYVSSDDEDLAADAEVLAIHNSAFSPADQPLSIMAEGVASVGFVPEEQQLTAVAEVTPVSMSSGGDSSSLWWDMDRRHLLLMMAPPPDTSSCNSSSLNLTEAAACQTPVLRSDSEGTEFDSPADTDSLGSSDSEMEFELPPPPTPPPKSAEESLAKAVQRLAAQRDSLDRRFRDVGEVSGGSRSGSLFTRELELYRRELLLRALASVRDQLDYQMLRLEQQPPPPPPPPPPRPQNCLRQASDPCSRLSILRCGPGERISYH